VLVDYWLAACYGRIWLTARGVLRLRVVGTDLPDLCAQVARGESLSAYDLRRAQDFATDMWWRSAMVAIVPFIVIVVATSATSAASFLLVLVAYAAVASLQSSMAVYRSGMIRSYLRKTGNGALHEPLPAGSLGVPRRWDFWAALAIGATMFAAIAYAGLHSVSHWGA